MLQPVFTIIALVIYILIVSLIGFLNRKNINSEDYFFAGRKLSPFLLAVTFIASWWGGGSAIDLVDQSYRNGLSSFWIYGVPVLIATAGMWLLASPIRKSKGLTQPQMIEERYGEKASLLLSILVLIFMILSAAVQVIVIGKMFMSLLGVSYSMAAVIGTISVLIYALFGGFRGVVFTDLLQFVFFLFAAVFLFCFSYVKGGGFSSLNEKVQSLGLIDYSNFWSHLSENLPYVLTFGAAWIIQANVWQRISAARTPLDARRMMGVSFFLFIPLYLMVTFTGMYCLVFFQEIPPEGLVVSMINQVEQPFLSILLFVGLCSAIMSTLDSLINTGSLTLTVDIIKKYIYKDLSPKETVRLGRYTTLVVTIIALFIALRIRSILQVSWIGGDFLASGAFVPLVMLFVWKKGRHKAAFISMVWGLLYSSYNLLVSLGLSLPVFWEIASAQQALIGMSISFILYMFVSLFLESA